MNITYFSKMCFRSEIHLKMHCVKTMELGISAIAVERSEGKPMIR